MNFIEYVCSDKFMKEMQKKESALYLWTNLWTNNSLNMTFPKKNKVVDFALQLL